MRCAKWRGVVRPCDRRVPCPYYQCWSLLRATGGGVLKPHGISFILSSHGGGASCSPPQAPIPLRGACRSPSDSAFWHELSNHHPDPDPQWARVRRRTPWPTWASTRTDLSPPPPGHQADNRPRRAPKVSEARVREAGEAKG
eukprot:scaffold58078_cov37-Tisochrysis_lutea.AAC.3